MNHILVKNFTAGGAVAEFAAVRFGSNPGEVVVATAASDLVIGVCCQPGGAAQGERVDVVLSGIADARIGGSVAAGAKLAAGTGGALVAAAPAAGVNAHVVGLALGAGASGDVAPVFLSQHVMQG